MEKFSEKLKELNSKLLEIAKGLHNYDYFNYYEVEKEIVYFFYTDYGSHGDIDYTWNIEIPIYLLDEDNPTEAINKYLEEKTIKAAKAEEERKEAERLKQEKSTEERDRKRYEELKKKFG